MRISYRLVLKGIDFDGENRGMLSLYNIRVIRSRRRTAEIEVRPDLSVVVRAPEWMPEEAIELFAQKKRAWIESKISLMEARQNARINKSLADRAVYEPEARTVICKRAAYFAEIMGVRFQRIAVREQKTRWGSCSSRGNLNFNWKLILMPEQILDYVVVHELAHLKQMNHSEAFWAEVGRVLPDYKAQRAWLKIHGPEYQ